MNPFHIGDILTVQFGTRQPMRVVALRHDACLMRLPHSTPMSKWYSVADLRLWNPCRAIVPAYTPVQFPAVVPGLRIYRPAWHGSYGTIDARDFTVVCVLHDTAFIRYNAPTHIAGSIHSKPLRTFWHDSQSKVQVSHESVSLSGAELRNIAEQWRDLVRTGNPLTTIWRRFNRGLDQLTPGQWDTLQAGWELHRTERKLAEDLRRAG